MGLNFFFFFFNLVNATVVLDRRGYLGDIKGTLYSCFRARAHWPLCSTPCGRALWRTRAHWGDMWRRHVCYVCKRSVCGGDEPQPVAHLSHKLQCARQSLKIMVSYGNKYPRHNARPHVVEQSGQCARALKGLAGKANL